MKSERSEISKVFTSLFSMYSKGMSLWNKVLNDTNLPRLNAINSRYAKVNLLLRLFKMVSFVCVGSSTAAPVK
jgi:hypothetical protein